MCPSSSLGPEAEVARRSITGRHPHKGRSLALPGAVWGWLGVREGAGWLGVRGELGLLAVPEELALWVAPEELALWVAQGDLGCWVVRGELAWWVARGELLLTKGSRWKAL